MAKSAQTRPQPTVSDLAFLASLNESKLDKEITLIANRMVWMMTSQTVLFSAYSLILLKKLEPASGWVMPGGTAPSRPQEAAQTLLNLIPIIAISALVLTIFSIYAAQSVVKVLVAERGRWEQELSALLDHPLPEMGIDRKSTAPRSRHFGNLPMYVMPWLWLLLWVFVLLKHYINPL